MRMSAHVQNPHILFHVYIYMPTSVPTVQSNMPNKNFVVKTATQVAVTYFYNSFLSCSSQMRHLTCFSNKKFCILDVQNLWSHVQPQIRMINRSRRQGRTCELTLLHTFLRGMDRAPCPPNWNIYFEMHSIFQIFIQNKNFSYNAVLQTVLF